MSTQKFATQALHAGHDVQSNGGTRAVPIYQSTAFVFRDSDHAANLFALAEPGNIYTRINNPTTDILEQRVAALDGGIAAVATSSGMAAIATSLLTLLRAGDHIVASSSLYGGTYNLLNVTLPRHGITTTFVDPSDAENFNKATQENTRVFFIESLGNPKLDVLDIRAISDVAKQNKVPLFVDNTVATSYLLKPIEHGADIVIHSLTKYANGNGTAIGGAIVDAGNFDWANGKFPEFTEPSPGYHGLVYADVLKNASFIAKVRIEGLRDYGSALSPFNAFQIIQGLETLELRIKQHSKNALELAKWLQEQDEVTWVNYPGLESSPYKALADKYLPEGKSGLVTFGVIGGYESAKTIADKTKLFSLLANIGDTKSLIIHPASTTHQQLSDEAQESTGTTKDLIRLSVGLEHIDDLKADLKQAFKIVSEAVLQNSSK
ncbi:MAG TPA: O-acetylhomoserine aminocarboxypropyltransferase/cysteine synthase family protein [Gelidibacter sp.]|uniref:O-acetylhomoserine aminocarboxypropyltransferase/cysteine synthase family protein n=1 Tax=Gelidibacter sp. TaxID=2018083 RepID=UPI002C395C8F|nr:O-acetylhomoserine aminocarboxypropyltransferase/cysteine synthase family protein [Gelidibacter sp.]HXJ98459.1 O-acetylhomoserine aminocarboxypropyltransferase/cysteine synthase family protein [Gelidibacter sp.]